jgi:4-cresol dehydrogenase (hydroxylating)
MQPSIQAALEEWSKILSPAAVLTGASLARYRDNCLGLARNIPAALQPCSESDVVGIVRIANNCQVPLYTISTGHNWGYGSALPVRDGCVILDLSRMDRILDMDPELGLVTLEPGVTQKQLFDYLDSRDLNFFVPTTGAGPTASIVGNALERGFGMTPDEDHFRAVTSIRAVLPNGTVYRSYMSEMGAEACGVWKWGIGPYLDGLFSQNNLGIVTSMQISLIQRPEHIEVYLFTLKKASEFPKLVHSCRNLLAGLRGHIGAIKVINQKQVELTIGTRDIGMNLAADFAWMGFGVIRCPRSMIRSIRREVSRGLPGVSRLVFVNEHRVKRMRKLQMFVPGSKGRLLKEQLDRMDHLLDIVNGIPRGLELKLVYGQVSPGALPLDPVRDGVGIIWYAPVFPFKIDLLTRMIDMITETLRKHGFDEAVSFTTINEKCAIGVIPIIYRLPDDRSKAHECFHELWQRGIQLGCHPYRVNVEAMPEMTNAPNSTFWDLAHGFKAAIDPNDIFSPGRYSSSTREALGVVDVVEDVDKEYFRLGL